jgi:uncharacterized protein (DUF362 family)
MTGHKVLIRRCDEYDPDRIAGIVAEGMEELGAAPTGRTLLKPNCVFAHPTYVPDAFTRAEFIDGVMTAVKDRAVDMSELVLGEKSGITLPTRWNFANADYPAVCTKHGARISYFEEAKQVPFKLTKEGRLRDLIYVPRPVIDNDFFINLPKLKAHPWTKMTVSLKNFIGIQDDRHRLVDHNSHLERKIADLQEVVQPQFIAVDGIVAGEKMMICAEPFPLGAIIMGTNSCAVDTVCATILNLDPSDVIHLQLSAARGYGPGSLDDIEVGGDLPLEEASARTRDFQIVHERIDHHFTEGPVSCTVGTFPEEEWRDYCWGGCPGALEEAMYLFRRVMPGSEDEMKPIRYVVGKVDGPLDLADGEKVLFVGDCTSWRGEIDGESVNIESRYTTNSELDPRGLQSVDPIREIFRFTGKTAGRGGKRWFRLTGCPVSQAEQQEYIALLGEIDNVGAHKELLAGKSTNVYVDYLKMRANRAWNHLFG